MPVRPTRRVAMPKRRAWEIGRRHGDQQPRGHLTPAQGAAVVVRLATLASGRTDRPVLQRKRPGALVAGRGGRPSGQLGRHRPRSQPATDTPISSARPVVAGEARRHVHAPARPVGSRRRVAVRIGSPQWSAASGRLTAEWGVSAQVPSPGPCLDATCGVAAARWSRGRQGRRGPGRPAWRWTGRRPRAGRWPRRPAAAAARRPPARPRRHRTRW